MSHRPASRGLVLFLVALIAAAGSHECRGQTFHDDFDGPSVDPTRWNLNLGSGAATFSGGRLTLSAPCDGQFPYLTSIVNPFPSTGDFVLRVGFRYPAVEAGGTGFGPDWVRRGGFWVWQDTQGKLSGQVGDLFLSLSSNADTSYHVYEWRYVGGTYSLTVDGQQKGSDQSDFRPTSIFFGHVPHTYCQWTTQEIDFVDVQGSSLLSAGEPDSPSLVLDAAYPNPARDGRLIVELVLADPAPAMLALLDVAGRRVIEREVGSLGVGRHELNLASGTRLAPGFYLVRLTQGASTLARSVCVLK